MSRFLLSIFLSLLAIPISAQSGVQIAETKCHAFQTVAGTTYLISVTPEDKSDVVLGVGFDPYEPMAVINRQGAGLSETYRVEADSNELQLCVYSNLKDANHNFVVIDIEDSEAFPFYMWSSSSTVTLATDDAGFISSFRFHWKYPGETQSKASSDVRGTHVIAGKSGISYTFKVTPGIPLDFLIVPETNHLDLAVHADIGNGYEVVDYDRSANNISETRGGQVEWFQAYPTHDEMTVVVENKSSYGGRFKLAARNLANSGPAIPPTSWRYMDPAGFKQFVDASRASLPLIGDLQAVTFEFTPSRTVEDYVFGAYAFEPGLDFALIVRTDPKMPPLFVQAGGESTRSASFDWRVIAGKVSLPRKTGLASEKLDGFPTTGKIQISIVGFGGSGRIGVWFKDAERLVPLEVPPHRTAARAEIMALFSAPFESFDLIQSNFRLYRFAAIDGESYNVKVTPVAYFDAVIMDPSGRTPEKPTSLELIDENGLGQPEYLQVTARGEMLEFAVAGTRYENGWVSADNKRLGGTGYYKYEVTDREGNTPRFLEKVEVKLPNEFVSNELNLIYQPWDEFPVRDSSDHPPFPVIYDKRILEAFGNP